MIISAKITLVQEPETIVFRDGTQHRSQNIWIAYEGGTEEDPEKWNTLFTLWDEKIEAFKELGYKTDDTLSIDMQLSYTRRDWNGRKIYNRDVKLRPVELLSF